MSMKSGDQAPKSGKIRCEACKDTIRVEKGDFIPTCANCGNDTFEDRKKK
ncbi:MAG: zinc ribbon-containing protein [Bacteroidota bacterium]|jgi:Zn finger protein HypA/HybF involved in hydrogenase expression